MENFMETSTYFRMLDISGFIIEAIVITWFCYYLFKKVKPFRPWGKIRRQKIDGPVGLDS
jgi:hypothetical protein